MMGGSKGKDGWLDSVAPHTRAIIILPDGPDYLITMPGWYWNCLWWMESINAYSQQSFVTFAWKTTLNGIEHGVWGNLENTQEIFTNTLMRLIGIEIQTLTHQNNGAINDCRLEFWPDPQPVIQDQPSAG